MLSCTIVDQSPEMTLNPFLVYLDKKISLPNHVKGLKMQQKPFCPSPESPEETG